MILTMHVITVPVLFAYSDNSILKYKCTTD